MGRYRVKCVSVDDSSNYNDCRCITEIGVPSKSGGTNTYTPARIYERIVTENDEFYVEHNRTETDLEPVNDPDSNYVRTESNDTQNDNLLQQPSC